VTTSAAFAITAGLFLPALRPCTPAGADPGGDRRLLELVLKLGQSKDETADIVGVRE
jgi:hypothetical protein